MASHGLDTKQFRSLADLIPQLVWMADADGTVLWVNRGWRDAIGAAATERSWTTHLVPASRPAAVLRWEEARASGEPMEMELSLCGQDGRDRPYLTRIAPLHAMNGAVHRWVGTHVDISEQHRREEQIRLLASELSHRMKNLMTVITAIATQTARQAGDDGHYRERLTERLCALSEGHDLLVREAWRGASLTDVIAAQMKPFMERGESCIESSGPPLVLTANAVQYIGLALHELATNACKHGALSRPGGRVSIRWRHEPATGRVTLSWREHDGPAVAVPSRRGFGCSLIDRIVPRALDGTGRLRFDRSGVTWTLDFPAERGLSHEKAA